MRPRARKKQMCKAASSTSTNSKQVEGKGSTVRAIANDDCCVCATQEA